MKTKTSFMGSFVMLYYHAAVIFKFVHASVSDTLDMDGNHRVLSVGYGERSSTTGVDADSRTARTTGVTARRVVIIAGNDVTVFPGRKSGLQSLSDGVIFVVDEDESSVPTTESDRLEPVVPPVRHTVPHRHVVEPNHVVHLAPSMLADPFAVEALDVFC
jgi:hypothetical protein